MNAYELCQRRVVTVRRHEDLTTAAWVMRERNVGCLVVVEPAGAIGGEKPIGLLTDRDIVTSVIARNCELHGLLVGDVMTSPPITVPKHFSVDDALRRMRNGAVRRVPVVDDRGRLAGILALDDIFEHLAGCLPVTATPIRRAPRKDKAAHL
ncbi:MAG: CBS domain-containing protein [Pseudomonadota bacterium]